MQSVLIAFAVFFLGLTIIAIKEYKQYEIHIRLNRQLVKPEDVKYNLFGFLDKRYNKIATMLKEAGLNVNTDDFILYFLYFSAFVIVVGILRGFLIYAVIIVLAAAFGVKVLLDFMKRNRIFKAEREFGTFATDLAVILKTNPNLASAIESVNKHSKPSLKEQVDVLIYNVKAGMSVENALKEFKNRMSQSKIITLWVDSIVFANMTGANLSEVCAATAEKVNEKLMRSIKIKSITSKTKGTVFGVLGVIVGMMIMTFTSSPDYADAYSTLTGHIILGYVLLSLTVTTYIIVHSIDRITKM